MACTTDRSEQIVALVHGRLDAEAAGEFLEHLAGCRACSVEFDLANDLVAAAPAAMRNPVLTLQRVLAIAAILMVAIALWWQPWSGTVRTLAELAQIDRIEILDSTLRGPGDPDTDPDRDAAIAAWRADDFATAARHFEVIVARDAHAALAQLYLGLARLQLGTPTEAVPALSAAVDDGKGLVQERALWYRAIAHLRTEAIPAARADLDTLVKIDGDYAPNARELLDALARLR